MGYWGWRPLILCVCISVWVAGCNIVTDAAPAPSATPSPMVTLTIRQLTTRTPPTPPPPTAPTALTYQVQPQDTWRGIAERFNIPLRALNAANAIPLAATLEPGQRLIIPLAAEASLLIPPVCYETPADSLLCLGTVENTRSVVIERAAVLVQLELRDGTLVTSDLIEIEQMLIPAGKFAPYRALFDVSARDLAGVTAVLLRAEPASEVEGRFTPLVVQQERSYFSDGRYVVMATLYNPGPDHARAVRAVVTLRDELGSIVGYRVARPRDLLRAGSSVPLRIEIVPQITAVTPTYTLYVEAQRGA